MLRLPAWITEKSRERVGRVPFTSNKKPTHSLYARGKVAWDRVNAGNSKATGPSRSKENKGPRTFERKGKVRDGMIDPK